MHQNRDEKNGGSFQSRSFEIIVKSAAAVI
jgi:hypothetical protein